MNPPDLIHRERISRDLTRNLFVEAGAGTGKTTALVERICSLVLSGVPMRNIAAITFTRLAAGELKDRIRRELESRLAGSNGAGRVIQSALDDVDYAAIETIHSFAQRILTMYPLEAGIPPGFTVLEGVESDLAVRSFWERLLTALQEDSALAESFQMVYQQDARFDKLQKIIKGMHENYDRLQELPVVTVGDVRSEIGKHLQALKRAAACCSEDDDKLLLALNNAFRCAEALDACCDAEELAEILPSINPSLSVGGKGAWSKAPDGKAGVVDLVKGFRECRDRAVSRLHMAPWVEVLNAAVRHVQDYAKERRASGMLNFQDLLVLARDLLRSHESVRQSLHNRFTHILVDEFQDTDPLQIEIAVLIAAEPFGSEFDWKDAKVEPGRLMFVGDPKQSIYRFRRADLTLYSQARDSGIGERIPLQANFRCSRPIIDWVNALFEKLMKDHQTPYERLEFACRHLQGLDAPVRVVGGQLAAKADDVRQQEAEHVARLILECAEGGAWNVREKGLDGSRAPRLSDIAILMPTRNALPALEDALEEYNIPYRVESRALVFSSREVLEILAVLRAVANPADQPALVAALRSPHLACSDRDLLQFRELGGRWGYLGCQPPRAQDTAVGKAMDRLKKLHGRSREISVGLLVEEVVRDLEVMELYACRRRPRESWRRVRFLTDQARVFSSAAAGSLMRFVEWCELQQEAQHLESVLPESDDHAVRILTIHAAKGLEFPIVFLCGLGTKFPDRRPELLFGPDGSTGVYISKERCIGDAAAADEMEKQERQRLLYVAATRAQCHLVVSLYHAASSCKRCHAGVIAHELPEQELYKELSVLPQVPWYGEQEQQETLDTPEDLDCWQAERDESIKRLASLNTRSVTSLVGPLDGAVVRVEEAPEEDEPAAEDAAVALRRGRGGTSTGRAVHAVLQTVNLATGEGLESAARAQAEAERLTSPEDVQRVVDLCRAALASDAVREAVSEPGARYWREVFVSGEVEGVLLEGFIDLLYDTPDGELHVVDYKTDASSASVESLMEHYRPQGGAYALLVKRALGKAVQEVTFVFVSKGVQRTMQDLEGAMAEVEERLREEPVGAEAAI